MIQTKTINLSPQELYKIMLSIYVRKRWWLYVWIWLLAILTLIVKMEFSSKFILYFMAIATPIYILWHYRKFAFSEQNKLFTLGRYYEIDENGIKGIIDDETFSSIQKEHFLWYSEIRDQYLLYIAKSQFIYIPKSAFEHEDDLIWFESNYLSGLKKR